MVNRRSQSRLPGAWITVGCVLVSSAFLSAGVLAASQELGKPMPQRSPQETYRQTCGYCHGANVGPIILGRGLPADATKQFVRNGMNTMPAFRPTEITPAELNALADWIRASKADPKEMGK